MKPLKIDKDAAPGIGATGAGAEEQRSCGPLDNSDPESEQEKRLAKQRHPVTAARNAPGQQPGTWTGVEHRESAMEERRESGPLDKFYRRRK